MNSGIPVVADQIDSMSPDPPSCLPPSIQERLAHYNQKWWLLALVRVDPNTKGNEAQIPIKVVWGVHPLTIAEQVTRQLEIRDQAVAALESIWVECIPYLPGATICEGIRGKGAIQWLWERVPRIQTERGSESTIASVFNKILILSFYPDARPLPADPHLANAKDIEQAASHARGALRIGKAVQEQKAILESLAHHSDQNSPEYVYRLSQLQTRGNEETESIWSLKIAIHYAKTHCWERFLQLKLLRNEAWIQKQGQPTVDWREFNDEVTLLYEYLSDAARRHQGVQPEKLTQKEDGLRDEQTVSEPTAKSTHDHATGPSSKNARKRNKPTSKSRNDDRFIAVLSTHHDFANGKCLKWDSIGCTELAQRAGVKHKRNASRFFKDHFGSHADYVAKCEGRDPALGKILSSLNREPLSRRNYGRTPPEQRRDGRRTLGERERDAED